MRKDGEATRGRILDAANDLIMEFGYGGTTVDEVIAKAGLTKGAFFYHFKSKEDLARALVERYAGVDRAHLEDALKRATSETTDPVRQMLILIDHFIELLRGVTNPLTGCIYASFCYQSGLLEAATLNPIRDMVLLWREIFVGRIREAIRAYPPRVPVSVDDLADQVLVAFEGGYVLAKTLADPSLVIRQLEQLRTYIALVFGREAELTLASPAAAARPH